MFRKTAKLRRGAAASGLLVAALFALQVSRGSAWQAPRPDESSRERPKQPPLGVGFRKATFVYTASGNEVRQLLVLYWYPTTQPAAEFDYRGQVGYVAPDAAVAPGRHPLVVFSHGFLGAADQAIYLTEAIARAGYIVVAPNHADALAEHVRKPVALPNFVDAKAWDDSTHFDRKEDVSALLDHLLALDRDDTSFLFERVDKAKIGAAGHSLGGYAVLGLAGARRSWHEKRIRAALLYSPYAMPYLDGEQLRDIRIPAMLQGGTFDWGITPFLPKAFAQLRGPKYLLVLKYGTHFDWTNFIALGKTTTEAAQEGNARWIVDYSVAFLDHHLAGKERPDILREDNSQLASFQFEDGQP